MGTCHFSGRVIAEWRQGRRAGEKVLERAPQANDANLIIVLRTLAAGYAESGRFSEAIDTAQRALQLALAQDNFALTKDLQSNIADYRRNIPLRDPGAANKAR